MFGCCGAPNRHLVRATESGRSLFAATGDGDMGRVGWADMPNAHPVQVRWAAFDGAVEEVDLAGGLVGTLAYGGDDGPRSILRLRLRLRAALLDANLNLSGGAELGWIDGKKTDARPRFQQGDVEGPVAMWVAEGAKSAATVGGFALVLRLGRSEIALIPIAADRLVAAKARLAKGYALIEAAPMR